MLVLGGTSRDFASVKGQEDGLYFDQGAERLTLYATVVLLLFVGLTVGRVCMLASASMWLRLVERREKKAAPGGEKVGVGSTQGWRARLDREYETLLSLV